MNLSKEISNWIRVQVEHAGKKGVVLGLSGGIDSSVVAVLSKEALGDNVFGLIMPCKSSSTDEKLAVELASSFDIKTKRVDLSNLFRELISIDPEASYLAKSNLKPRLRMIVLYYFANSWDYLVAGTGNKSELMTGYFTKYGDGGCDILPLGGLLKTEVRKLAQDLNIPSEIVNRPSTAGLWDGQTDEEEIGISYESLDECIQAMERDDLKAVERNNLAKVRLMIENSSHKRNSIPVFNSK